MQSPKARVRFSSCLYGDKEITYTWAGDGYASVSSAGHRISLQDFNLITDVVGTVKSQRVKPCIHAHAHYRGLPMQPFLADYGLAVIFTDGLLPWTPFQSGIFEDEHLCVPHSVRVQAAGRAFTAFSERFPTKISGAEFLQGLTELRALLPRLLGSLQRTIASAYLTKKFGWDNLLSDLRALSSAIGSIQKRMEFLKRTYGKPTRLYRRENTVHTIEPWVVDDTVIRGFGMRFSLESYRADFIASCTLVQRLKHIDDFIGWLRAIVISLGLNNPVKAVWQTSRLSFVVDWFTDVSGHLDRLAAIQPADEWNVYDISSTVVWEARVRVTQVNEGLNGGTPDQETELGIFSCKRYERLVGLPVDLTVFTPSTCTPDQLVLLLAMAASK